MGQPEDLERLESEPAEGAHSGRGGRLSGSTLIAGKKRAPAPDNALFADRDDTLADAASQSPASAGRAGLDQGMVDDFHFYEDVSKLRALREQTKSLYRRLPSTREWIEQQYYQLPLNQQSPDLVSANRFWRDYASHRGDGFLSPYFVEAHRSLTEMMFALAVLDLPEQAPEHEVNYANNSMSFTAGGPLIVFHQQFQPAELEADRSTILVTENFFQKNDRVRHQDGVPYDKFIFGKFHAHTLYGAQVVLTNPTSTPQAMDLLVQIPQGSIAASGSKRTRTLQIQLDAFNTRTFEYYFYFPTAGNFDHYPAHVSREDRVLAVADPQEFKVDDAPVEVDNTSWQFVSQNGSEDQVIEFLQQKNVLRYELDKIAFRMKDKQFFGRAINTLRSRRAYDDALWSYAIYHQDADTSREFLQHENRIADQVGKYFVSTLLNVFPYQRNWYQHREYRPLINARIHQLGARRKILNPDLHQQYHLLLEVLSQHEDLESADHLVLTYYLLLQDRIDEAIRQFEKVQQEQLVERIQYEYCNAYLDFYRANPESAAAKAAPWADYPVDLWRQRFQDILAQVDEIRGGNVAVTDDQDIGQKQTQLAADAPSFDFEIESRKVKVAAQNVSRIQVNYYEMDVELMFSRSPFAEKNYDRFSVIRPNSTQSIELERVDDQSAVAEFEIPAQFANRNLLVEINAGDQVKAKPTFASSMLVQTIEKYGQLKVTRDEGQQPIPQAYVKVYSRRLDGSVKFHKDGYTDLRGRFDYVSQSNNPLDNIAQYSILVLSGDHGVVTRQVAPPAE